MNRRTVLKGGLVLAISSHTAVATAVSVDPILDAIAAYRRAWEEFLAAPDEQSDEVQTRLWKNQWKVLRDWTAPAQTREGALAALALAVEEEEIGESQLTGPMMKAAYSFLTTGDAA